MGKESSKKDRKKKKEKKEKEGSKSLESLADCQGNSSFHELEELLHSHHSHLYMRMYTGEFKKTPYTIESVYQLQRELDAMGDKRKQIEDLLKTTQDTIDSNRKLLGAAESVNADLQKQLDDLKSG